MLGVLVVCGVVLAGLFVFFGPDSPREEVVLPFWGVTLLDDPADSKSRCVRVNEVYNYGLPPLRWEEVRLQDRSRGASHEWRVIPGQAGQVEPQDRVCGLKRDAFYDFIYVPKAQRFFILYPLCFGGPEPVHARDCNPPE